MNRSERRRRERLARRERDPAGARDSAAGKAALGQVIAFLEGDNPADALALAREVLTVRPRDPEVLNLAGVAAFRASDHRQALQYLRAALTRRPDFADAHTNLGNLLRETDKISEAEAAYRRALEIAPGDANAQFNLGVLLEAKGDFAEAEAAYRAVVDARPEFSAAWFNLGNVLKAFGRLAESEDAYRRAIAARPQFAAAHCNLGSVVQEDNRLDEAAAAYRQALICDPNFTEAHYNLGIALQEQGDPEAALSSYNDVLAREPGHIGARVNIGYALRALGRLDEAEASYRKTIALAPDYDKLCVNFGDLMLERGRPKEALAAADEFLAAHPGNRSVLAFKAMVLRELGAVSAARELLGLDDFIQPNRIETPDGFADLAGFNTALADHVLAHPSLVRAPASHATRHGRHTGELLLEPKGPVAALEAAIIAAATAYLAAPPAPEDHPLHAGLPKKWELAAWAVAMDRQGHQLPHIHPAAWLSGVYYVRLPDVIAADDAEHAGWIEFGRPPADFNVIADLEIRLLQPEEGLLVLFPSYLYHRTVPFESDQTRISIAFDLRPI